MKAAIYSRKSKFTGKGESIENQVQLCMDYAKSLGIKEFLVYEDEGFSGGSTDRPKFKEMIEDAKNKKFDYLICYRLDRISRNVSDFSSLIEDLNKLDISFISIKEQFDTSTPMGRAMMYISSVFAQLERETIAERIKDNMYELARSGRWLGGITPTGFNSEKISYYDENMNQRYMSKLSVNKKEMNLVKVIYNKYEELQSLHKVEKYLQEANIKGKNNGNLDKSTINSILRNPCYAVSSEEIINYLSSQGMEVVGVPDGSSGFLTYAKQSSTPIVSVAKHKGIIPSEKWLNIQLAMDKNKSKAPRNVSGSKVSLLSGLLRCSCGSKMRINYGKKRADGSRPFYYVCSRKSNKGTSACNSKNVKGDDLENVVINEIKSTNRGTFINDIEKAKSSLRKQSDDYKKEIQLLSKEIDNKKSSISVLVRKLAVTEDGQPSDYILSEITNIDKEIQVLNSKLETLENLNNNLNMQFSSYDIVRASIDKFNNEFDSLDFENKRLMLFNIVDRIIWDGNTGDVSVMFLGIKKKEQ